MLSFLFPLVALASFSFGAAITKRVSGITPCDGLGRFIAATRHNFTLAALNQTLSNVNKTGIPLVLASDGAISGAEFETLATWASFPYNDWTNLSMDAFAIVANSNDSKPRTVATDASNGTAVTFISTNESPQPTAAPIFCSVGLDGLPNSYPLLAMDNHYDLFSVCDNNGIWRVIYNVTYGASSIYFDSTTCFPVYLQIIGGTA